MESIDTMRAGVLERALVVRGWRWDDATAASRAVTRLADALLDARLSGTATGDIEPLCALDTDSLLDVLEPFLGRRGRALDGRGVWYTPAAAAQVMATWGLPDDVSGVRHVLDPACGTGRLLLAALRRLLSQRSADTPAARLRCLEVICGTDVDAAGLEVARLALWWEVLAVGDWDAATREKSAGPRLKVGNPLLPADGAVGLVAAERPVCLSDVGIPDGACVVLSNPPYVGSDVMKKFTPALREVCRGRFEAARGNWDLYCVFVELAARWTRPGGRHVLLVPRALASASYATGARRFLACEGVLSRVWDRVHADDFTADVYPLMYAWERRPAREDDEVLRVGMGDCMPHQMAVSPSGAPWPVVGTTSTQLTRWRQARQCVRLGDVVSIRGAATVGEAYQLRDVLRELRDVTPNTLRVVNSGTIDPHEMLWGERPMRYLGQRWLCPAVDSEALGQISPRRLAEARSPKVIVANMTRRLEAAADLQGDWLGAKSTTLLLPGDRRLVAWWAAVMGSEAASEVYQAMFGGLAMSGGYLRVGPPQLRQLWVPAPPEDLEGVMQAVQLLGQPTDDASRTAALAYLEESVVAAYREQACSS